MRKISVIIPTRQRDDLLRQCLLSLRQQTFSDFETVLVSNDAGQGARQLAHEFGCGLLEFAENLGFAAAVNRGVGATGSEYVAVLNDDVELEKSWLEQTAAFLDARPEASFCCGKILQAQGTLVDNAGDALSLGGSAWRIGHGRSDSPAFDVTRPVFAVSGTALLVRRIAWGRLEGFDEDFFAYLEDMDFSLRAFQAGERGYYLPGAVCRHHGGATLGGPESGPVFRLLTRNQLLLLVRHYRWPLWLRLWPRIAWAQWLWFLMALRKKRLGSYGRGVIQFLGALPRALAKRRRAPQGDWRALLAWLKESEREIYTDITAPDRTRQDTFWKMYFGLFAPPKAPERESGLGECVKTTSAHPSASLRTGPQRLKPPL